VAQILQNQGVTLSQLADDAEARRVDEEALRIYEAALGPEHPQTIQGRLNLAAAIAKAGDDAAAIVVFTAAADAILASQGPRTAAYGSVLRNLAVSHRRLGHADVALGFAEDAFAVLRAALGPEHRDVAAAAVTLAGVAIEAAAPARAVEAAEEARRIGVPTPRGAGLAALHLAQGLDASGRDRDRIAGLLDEARAQFERAGDVGESSLALLRRWAVAHGYDARGRADATAVAAR
jgi:tetratricopeptide (TPR) repeat protein